MKKISLTQNQYAIVDDVDYQWLNAYRWFAHRNRYTFYAERNIQIDGKGQKLLMHRLILGLGIGDCKQTDHIDGNGLNNQRANLRVCSKAENQHNQRPQRNVSSYYKGVTWHRNTNKWQVRIVFNGKHKYLGLFNSEMRAAEVYNRAAKNLFGEYARLNKFQGRIAQG